MKDEQEGDRDTTSGHRSQLENEEEEVRCIPLIEVYQRQVNTREMIVPSWSP